DKAFVLPAVVRLNRRLGHAAPGLQRFLGALFERHVRRQHHRARAHFVVRRIDAGGVTPLSTSALAARISRCRAMMMPLSVETRFSLVRSQFGPMLSCIDESCIAKPPPPLKVLPAFWAPRWIR